MTLKSVLELITQTIAADGASWLVFVIIIISVVQIAPIQLNPWSTLAGWLGRALNKTVIDKVDSVGKKVESVEKKLNDHILESESQSLQQQRSDILSFGSSVISGKNYNKEKFDFMIMSCDRYEGYCKEHKVVNGVADATIREIRRIYSLRLSEDSFLKEGKDGQET